jgi:NTE family protein
MGHEFSVTSMRDHWAAGYSDTKRTLRRVKWLVNPPEDIGMTAHDTHRDGPTRKGGKRHRKVSSTP